MNAKKQKRSAEKARAKQQELKKNLTSTRGQLTRTEKKLKKATERAERWKKKAKVQQRSAARAMARAKKLKRKLDQASTVLEPVADTQATEDTAGAVADTGDTGTADTGTADTAPTEAATPESSAPAAAEQSPTTSTATKPDKTWTVVQLRAEATARGLTGVSNKPKAQLLTALS